MGASWRWAAVTAVTGAKRYRDRGRRWRKSSRLSSRGGIVSKEFYLSWPRTEGRARGEGAGAHAETRAEGRRDVAEEVAAAGAVAIVHSGNGDIGAHPLAAGFAERVDTLHGKTGQVLHVISL
jgi:hypothetical protein